MEEPNGTMCERHKYWFARMDSCPLCNLAKEIFTEIEECAEKSFELRSKNKIWWENLKEKFGIESPETKFAKIFGYPIICDNSVTEIRVPQDVIDALAVSFRPKPDVTKPCPRCQKNDVTEITELRCGTCGLFDRQCARFVV